MKDTFKVTFVTPHVGRKDPTKLNQYVRTWQMMNLPVATLAGLTPNDFGVGFYDERVEFIDFDDPTDLAAVTIETFNAKRAYEIAAQYHKRGVPVVMGGYHATLIPQEVKHYADSVVVGFAEAVWEQALRDAQRGHLKPFYARDPALPMRFGMPDRTILGKRDYVRLALVETGRGCPLQCNFCTITAATHATYHPRPIDQIVRDIDAIKRMGGPRYIFFVDDNIGGNKRYAKQLFRELAPLKVRWFSQGTLSMAQDEELLKLMADSGCAGLLVGFEALRKETLLEMNKRVNIPYVESMKTLVDRMHQHGIGIYGTFIFGYGQTQEDFKRTLEAAVDMKLFMAAFNPLIPFPGTALYHQMLKDGSLRDPQWYLDPDFRFGTIPHEPRHMSAQEIHDACIEARRQFYSARNVAYRASNWRGNAGDPAKLAAYLYINWALHHEIDEKDGLPLGNEPVRPEPEVVGSGITVQL